MENKIIQDELVELEDYLKKLELLQEELKNKIIKINEMDCKDNNFKELTQKHELNIKTISELVNKVNNFRNSIYKSDLI